MPVEETCPEGLEATPGREPFGKDGRVLLGGFDILSVENPIWDGKAPDIRYPE